MLNRNQNNFIATNAVAHQQGKGLIQMAPPVQRVIKPVTEEVIIATKAQNPEIEEDYLDGLYYGSDGKTYVYAGKMPESFLKGDGRFDKQIDLFVKSGQMTEDAINTLLETADLTKITFVSKDEKIAVTGQQIKDITNSRGIVKDDLPPDVTYGDHIFQRLLDRAIDAEPIGGAGGEFGNVEFRFKATRGVFFTSLTREEATDEAFQAKWGQHVGVRRITAEELNYYKTLYRTLELPYPAERLLDTYMFVSEHYVKELDMYDSIEEAEEYPNQTHFDILKKASDDDPPIPAPAADKTKTKAYTRTAIRGDRGTGQKAAMGNFSAKQYADFYTDNQAENIDDWEWLHLQGSRLGGKNERGNLVAGTASANSHMIPYEREILALSRDADNTHPVTVNWTATLKSVGGEKTHIGDKITIDVQMPQGTKSNDAARNFSKTFGVTEGQKFTKFDRDSAHYDAKAFGARQ